MKQGVVFTRWVKAFVVGSMHSEFFIRVGHEVAFAVNDDGCAFHPLGAVLGNPVSRGPFTDVIAAGENAGTLDVSDFDDVFVFGENVAKLLAGGSVAHRAVDVLENFSGVPWAIAQEFLDFFTDPCCFHLRSLLS